jgi:hypothetical protein
MARVFISYVTENACVVDRLSIDLKRQGIDVWVDRDSLLPGQHWRDEIRNAIQGGDFFIACFSMQYHQREKSYMNEELVLAIDELRSRSITKTWFIPVILNECDIPARNIGAGETLLDLQWVNLVDNWEQGIKKITQVILNDELQVAKKELDSLAHWIAKKELNGRPSELITGYVTQYQDKKDEVFHKFGVTYDPRKKQYSPEKR